MDRLVRTLAPAALCSALACAPAHAARPPVPAIPTPQQVEAIGHGLVVREVARDAWVVTEETAHDTNVLVVRLGDGTLVLCSSPFDTAATRTLVEWLRSRHAPPRMVAVNTHWHLDGTGGNEAYREAGVTTYASTHTQALSTERGNALRRDAAAGFEGEMADRVRRTALVPADRTFEEEAGLVLELGGERIEVMHPGRAHSADNVVVFFPARGILFGGCMIKVGDSLGYLGDASVEGWGPALDAVEGLGARIVVPGHGPAGGPELIEHTRRLVAAARPGAASE
jgi:glyoxylase-like metal-dependent hydrolase (beta-lactamase superfamily II)